MRCIVCTVFHHPMNSDAQWNNFKFNHFYSSESSSFLIISCIDTFRNVDKFVEHLIPWILRSTPFKHWDLFLSCSYFCLYHHIHILSFLFTKNYKGPNHDPMLLSWEAESSSSSGSSHWRYVLMLGCKVASDWMNAPPPLQFLHFCNSNSPNGLSCHL